MLFFCTGAAAETRFVEEGRKTAHNAKTIWQPADSGAMEGRMGKFDPVSGFCPGRAYWKRHFGPVFIAQGGLNEAQHSTVCSDTIRHMSSLDDHARQKESGDTLFLKE